MYLIFDVYLVTAVSKNELINGDLAFDVKASEGLYRPTYASIMNSGGEWEEFNAPSRWAIYKRIMELAGESCKFEDFLEYDKKNLEAMKAKKARQRSASNKQENTGCAIHSCAHPIIYDYPSTEIGKHQ